MTAAPLDIRPRIRFPVFVLASIATVGGAYYTGLTGDPAPLLLTASGLGGLLVLTTDYETLEE